MRSAVRRAPCARRVLPVLVLLASFIAAPPSGATGVRLFTDSPDPVYLDLSWGTVAAPSSLELAHTDKFPVDTTRRWSGANSLRLRWTSAAGGSWDICVATPAWTPTDIAPYDSLVFWAWSSTAVPRTDLPLVCLEDILNARTPKHPLRDFAPDLPAAVWTRVTYPLRVFRQDPGTADLTRLKTVFFSQNPLGRMGVPFHVLLDELRLTRVDPQPPAAPAGLVARGWERHVDIGWGAPGPAVESVRIHRVEGGQAVPIGSAPAEDAWFRDWRGAPGMAGEYRLSALDWNFRESPLGASLGAATRALADSEWLDMVEAATFRYFWDHAHPVSGLARERYGSGEVCATGGTGMGLMALVVGAERGYVPRAAAAARVRLILEFYATRARSYHGAFSHWLDGATGASIPFDSPTDSTGDIVETAFLAQGMLAVRQYFDGADSTEARLRKLATQLWRGVDWEAYRPVPPGDAIYWLWSPARGFTTSFPVAGWNECLAIYLLAASSPTHPVPARCYLTGWSRYGAMRNGNSYYGYPLAVGPDFGGPLFFAHYSFLGFDPRAKRDTFANYFEQNRNHALIHRAYCAANPLGRAGYSAHVWGLTASDNPWGYGAHAPYGNDNGTLAPTAALASMPYTPDESLDALKSMYVLYGDRLWGSYGFRDAFNPGQDWFAPGYIAIDQGPIIVMIENARSRLLWDRFMRNPEIAVGLDSLGFRADPTGLDVPVAPALPAAVGVGPIVPNPFHSAAAITFDLPCAGTVDLSILDIQGRRVTTLIHGPRAAGRHTTSWRADSPDGRPAPAGVYLCRLSVGGRVATRKLLRLE